MTEASLMTSNKVSKLEHLNVLLCSNQTLVVAKYPN